MLQARDKRHEGIGQLVGPEVGERTQAVQKFFRLAVDQRPEQRDRADHDHHQGDGDEQCGETAREPVPLQMAHKRIEDRRKNATTNSTKTSLATQISPATIAAARINTGRRRLLLVVDTG